MRYASRIDLAKAIVPHLMHPRPAFHIRSARAVTALLTVWCLGCTAFDPLIDSLFGRNVSAESCISDMPGDRSPGGSGVMTVTACQGNEDEGLCCGSCGSCHSTSPQLVAIEEVQTDPHHAMSLTARPLASVTRAPVAPPPERRTL